MAVNPSESASHGLASQPGDSHNARISGTPRHLRLFLTENLPLLQQVVRHVARRHRLRDHEVEELLGAVQLKLIENDYKALRRFEGRSTLATYFRSIVTRHLLDERTATWGKWRPSIYAKRQGTIAMHLELLMTRDGLEFNEAVEILRSQHHVVESDEDLYRLSLGFPTRVPRRFVDASVLEEVAVHDPVDQYPDHERRAVLAARTGTALQAAVAALAPQDRLLLKMHFEQNLPLSKIARVLGVDQKPLYRRKEHVLGVLERELIRQGLGREEIVEIFGESVELDPAAGDLTRKVVGRPST